MKNVTISDIASRAGVSKATVSRVLNSPEKVEENTRRKIQQIMKEAHYTPSATARNLSRQISSTIGVIVPEISNTFFGKLFSGLEEVINKNNLSLLYSSNEDDADKDFMALDMMRTQRVRGVLYIPAVNYRELGMLKKLQRRLEILNCPVVCIDRDIGLHLDTIHFADGEAVKNAVLELARAGHEDIAIINGNNKRNVLASERYQGYLEGFRQAKLHLQEQFIFQGEFKKSYAYQITKELLQHRYPPTAVITCNNSLGKGYLQAVYEAGEQKKFIHISLDQIEMLDLLGIPHNYIRRDSYEMGKRAAEMLISRLAFPAKTVQNILLEAPIVKETF